MAFTTAQIRRLSDKLDSAYVRTRRARGAELVYIEGWHAISEANRIFGHDAWDRQTLSVECVWTGMVEGEHATAYTAKVRIQVRAGSTTVIREGCGTGEARGASSGEAHDMALKAAETDATKRALATFGNPFGLALYDRNLSGVRRPGRIARQSDERRHIDKHNIVWALRSANGTQGDELGSPQAFAEALRSALDAAPDTEAAFQLWEQNSATLRALHRLNQSYQTPISAKDLSARFKARAIALAKGRGEVGPEVEVGTPGKTTTPSQSARFNGTRITKSELKFGAPRRLRSKEHLRFVASQSCVICGRRPSQAHHIRYAQPRALARKVSDEYVVPLCSAHHDAVHQVGDERGWWLAKGIDPLPIAGRLWSQGGARRTDQENPAPEASAPA